MKKKKEKCASFIWLINVCECDTNTHVGIRNHIIDIFGMVPLSIQPARMKQTQCTRPKWRLTKEKNDFVGGYHDTRNIY